MRQTELPLLCKEKLATLLVIIINVNCHVLFFFSGLVYVCFSSNSPAGITILVLIIFEKKLVFTLKSLLHIRE